MAKHDIELREPETEPSLWAVALAVSLAFNAVILVGVAPGTFWPSGKAAVEPVEPRVAMPAPPAPVPETRVANVPIAPEPAPILRVVEAAGATALPAAEAAPAAVRPKPKPQPAKPVQSATPQRPEPAAPESVAMPVLPPEPTPAPVVAVAPPPPPASAPLSARDDDFLPPEVRHRAQVAIGPFRMSVPSWQPLPAAMTR
jgi:hypothetical protein